MNSPIIRCPICRDAVEATEPALAAHDKAKKHTDWQKFRSLWHLDRRAALFIGAAEVVAVLVLTIWALVAIGGR